MARTTSPKKNEIAISNIRFEPGVPAYELINTEMRGRYRIEKEILTDPYRNVVLQKFALSRLPGTLSDYQLYALLSPHLANWGSRQYRMDR